MSSRRNFIRSVSLLSGASALQLSLPAWAKTGLENNNKGIKSVSGNIFDLTVSQSTQRINDKLAKTILVNKQLPAPLLRWREGEEVVIRVKNNLHEDTSIHWHGILLPFQMDGVPGVTFPGIKPGEAFIYKFPIKQAGTYWYHSHSGFQEQLGHYGPIIIEPKNDPVKYDREYVILLSDWSFEKPKRIFSKLKKMSDSYNYQQRTVGDFFNEVKQQGFDEVLSQRMMWGDMRMNPTDISDVTASTYTYLLNGHSPAENWSGLYKPGEKIRLRFINASAMSIFNIRIPSLPMTVVQADGLDVQPVETDEFQIGTAETYDVIVQPKDKQKAYTIMCESNDRSGYAQGTLTTTIGLTAAIPDLRQRPTLTMKDMAMSEHAGHDMSKMSSGDMEHSMKHHDSHDMMAMKMENSMQAHNHKKDYGVVGLAMNPVNRLSERPSGLENADHRVLVYSDLKSLEINPDLRSPERELELHLTSNMERYMWSFDGIKFSEVDGPIKFKKDERLRLTLVNDTMMPHPIHLHGMFFDLVTTENDHKPRKHTIVVKPGEKLSVDITADAVGDWAFHCHLLYHMMAGMMRVVSVRDDYEKLS
ncbi:MAG: copper resistance system multicopper oxidase [Gammaproteobacteria bacterium]